MQGLKKKAKPLPQIKSIHNEHIQKIQNKQQLETDLLDDVRSYCHKRANIEREYGQALQKLSQSYLVKKELSTLTPIPHENESSIWYVWRAILQQTLSIAQSRIQTSDTQLQLAEKLKPLRAQRAAASKRIVDQMKSLQFELMECLQEMVKAHKIYSEEEKQAHDARQKAKEAEQKVRKKSTTLFNSMANLQKTSVKLSERRIACENRSTASRNEYLFQLAAINAHLDHYFTVDVPDLARIMDGEIYEKMGEVFVSLIKHEIEARNNLNLEETDKLLNSARNITREYTWQQFIRDNPSFGETIQYDFVPMEGDSVNLLCPPTEKKETLINVSKKLVKRLVLREKKIQDYQEEMKNIQEGKTTAPIHQRDCDSNGSPITTEDMLAYNQEYIDQKVEDLYHTIRRGEIEMVKIKACLELLKDSGVDVTTMLNEAAIPPSNSSSKQSSSDKLSLSSGRQSAGDGTDINDADESVLSIDTTSNASSCHNKPARRSLWAIDMSVDGSSANSPSHGTGESPDQLELEIDESEECIGVALFEFKASRNDEMSVVVDEHLVVLAQGESDGWLKVRSKMNGQEGLVPMSFLHLNRPFPAARPSSSAGGSSMSSCSQMQSRHHSLHPGETDSDGEEDDQPFHTYMNWGPVADGKKSNNNNINSNSGSIAAASSFIHRGPARTAPVSNRIQSQSNNSSLSSSSDLIAVVTPRVIDRIDEDSQQSHLYVNINPDDLERMRQKRRENRKSALTVTQASTCPVNYESQDIVIAIFHFDGAGSDELSFKKDALIRVISKLTEDGVDDGWWEGELVTPPTPTNLTASKHPLRTTASLDSSHSVTRGYFPSMVVEDYRPSLSSQSSQVNGVTSSGVSSASSDKTTRISTISKIEVSGRTGKPNAPFDGRLHLVTNRQSSLSGSPRSSEPPDFTPPTVTAASCSQLRWQANPGADSHPPIGQPLNQSMPAPPLSILIPPVTLGGYAGREQAGPLEEKQPLCDEALQILTSDLDQLPPPPPSMLNSIRSMSSLEDSNDEDDLEADGMVASKELKKILTSGEKMKFDSFSDDESNSSDTNSTSKSKSKGSPANSEVAVTQSLTIESSVSGCLPIDSLFPLPQIGPKFGNSSCDRAGSVNVTTPAQFSHVDPSIIYFDPLLKASTSSRLNSTDTISDSSSSQVTHNFRIPICNTTTSEIKSSTPANRQTAASSREANEKRTASPAEPFLQKAHQQSGHMGRSPCSTPTNNNSLPADSISNQLTHHITVSSPNTCKPSAIIIEDNDGGDYVRLSQQISGQPNSISTMNCRPANKSMINSKTAVSSPLMMSSGHSSSSGVSSTSSSALKLVDSHRVARPSIIDSQVTPNSLSNSSVLKPIPGPPPIIKPIPHHPMKDIPNTTSSSSSSSTGKPTNMTQAPAPPQRFTPTLVTASSHRQPSTSPVVSNSPVGPHPAHTTCNIARPTPIKANLSTSSSRPVNFYPVSEIQRMGMYVRNQSTASSASSSAAPIQFTNTSLTPASARVPQSMIEAAGARMDACDYEDTSDEEYDIVEV